MWQGFYAKQIIAIAFLLIALRRELAIAAMTTTPAILQAVLLSTSIGINYSYQHSI